MVIMGNLAVLQLYKRNNEEKGKSGSRRLRKSGWIPAVLYSQNSGNGETDLVKLKAKDFEKVLISRRASHHLLSLSLEGEEKKGIIKEIQRNPLKNEIWHIDFYEVKSDQKISLSVPVVVKGEAKGVKEGGILEIVTTELEIECLPEAIPEAIVVEVSNLEIGDAIHVRDLVVPEGIVVAESPDEVVVVVTPPETIEEAVASEEETVEPKVISKGKAEKEEARGE
ncbi:MAG: 50S ribosomal protein L25 [Candidatus Caldatribacteriaceae bacterium]